jgi:glucokinase-like ROK family protein
VVGHGLAPAGSWAFAEGVDATHLVLESLRLGGSRSRSQIAERTGLGRAVVAQRVGDLIRRGVVEETTAGASTGGRPPRHLRFRSESGSILAVDLGATSVDVALTDLAGEVLEHRSEPGDIADGPESVLARVEALADEIVARTGAPAVWGIGIGVPGPVEFGTGRPVAPPIMPGWDGYPIRERLERRYTAPVWVDNDVNLMAMGEWRRGAARGHRNVVFVKVGTGIGAGLISDGVLHRGSQGAAGDVGHIQIADDRTVVCRCGNVGCLEALAGGQALGRDAEHLVAEGRSTRLAEIADRDGTLSAASVAEAARRGDPASLELLSQAGRLVGSMLASIVNFFNPSLIVIGGGVAGSGDAFIAATREAVYRRSLPLATRDLQIVRSELGPLTGVVGAAAIVTDELFSRDLLAATLAPSRHEQPDMATSTPVTNRRAGRHAGESMAGRLSVAGAAAVEEPRT